MGSMRFQPITAALALAFSSVAMALDGPPPVGDGVVTSRRDSLPVKHPATSVLGIQASATGLRIAADGDIGTFDVIELETPPRLALDLYGVRNRSKVPSPRGGPVNSIRVGPHADKVRVVVEFSSPTKVEVRRRPGGLNVTYEKPSPVQSSSNVALTKAPPAMQPTPSATVEKGAPSPPTRPAPTQLLSGVIRATNEKQAASNSSEVTPLGAISSGHGFEARPLAPARPASEEKVAPIAVPELATRLAPSSSPAKLEDKPAVITDVRFVDSAVGGMVEVTLSGAVAFEVSRPEPKGAVLNIHNARIARALEKNVDTTGLVTPIKTVSVFSVPGPTSRVRIAVAASEAIEQSMERKGNVLRWQLRARDASERVLVSGETAPALTQTAPAPDAEANDDLTPRRGTEPTARVSFEFKDIDIHNLLRMLAEISRKNIIVSDEVTGKITLRLRNVPWTQALDLVLRSKSLGKEEFGNIIRVAPLSVLESEAKARVEQDKARRLAVPLSVNLIPVNYATADGLAPRVKDILSERGTVTTDTRTNTLIVRELPENLARVRALVANLDLETPQVLIESRIVEASISFSRQLGIQWGGQFNASPGTGNPTGLVFPNSISLTGGASNTPGLGNSASPNYAVSLPVGVGDGTGGALGLVLGSAGSAAVLNFRLSASEASGTIKTISAPKVATLDNTTARISQGVSIPFAQVSAAGVNTQFVEARLSLDVTPHITRDGSVLMQVTAQNNQPDPANSGANGQPGISRKEASTHVMVKDGDTTVIGGIYVRTGASNEAGIPFLNRIPILGFFFRNSRESETKNELLIFITPRILNRAPVAQNP